MLIREFVINKASQPVELAATLCTNGYTGFQDRLYILYQVQLPWKAATTPSDAPESPPIIVGFRADEHMIGESYLSADKPILTWVINRAREIMDERVLSQRWTLHLTPAVDNDYFHVVLVGDKPDPVLQQKLFGYTTWHWTHFFQPDSPDYTTIHRRYARLDQLYAT